MRTVSYSMNASLDGFVEDAAGGFDWSVPAPDVFRAHIEEIRGVGVHLLGRRLHETMRYWETADASTFDDDEREWATLWNALPKVVFSRTLTEVPGSNTRLATGTLAEEIARWRDEPGDGDIAIGGAILAAEAADLGLIDEYRVMVHPVLVGGGKPYFARNQRQVELELVDTHTFSNGVVRLRHRVRR